MNTGGTASEPGRSSRQQWERNRSESKMAEKLARQIIDDSLSVGRQPGDTLPTESEMMSIYDVARATLREALRLLEVQGVIWIKRGPGGGPVLAELSPEHFAKMAKLHLQVRGATYRQLLDARTEFEPLMARLAARAQNPDGLQELRRVIEESRQVKMDDELGFQRNATEFHVVLSRISGNAVLDLLGASLQDVYQTGAAVRTPLSRRRKTRALHVLIADAVFAGDADLAEKLMREHMEDFDRASRRSHLHSVHYDTRIRWE